MYDHRLGFASLACRQRAGNSEPNMTKAEMHQADIRAQELPTGMTFDVPNLDDMSIDPADYAAIERVLDRLALYCEYKRRSMELRLKGDTEAALGYERELTRTYNNLPAWAQW